MSSFTDQLGRTITLHHPPARIISLVPSQTELLYTLGLDTEVVGITKFCVHPPAWFRTKPRIGGTKDIHTEKIAALQPDLIIANKEENVREQIESLAASYPVWMSDIHDLTDALAMIRSLGDILSRQQQAASLAEKIQNAFDTLAGMTPAPTPSKAAPLRIASSSAPGLRTAYLIWRTGKPLSYMAAGSDTFINDMLQRCGLTNIFANQPRYPTIDPATLATLDPQLVLLSSEPYPFRDKHIQELEPLLPEASIRLVDGELFSWYGSRLLHAPDYFRQLLSNLHP